MINGTNELNEKNTNTQKENAMSNDETINTVEDAIRTCDLETALRIASAQGINLKDDWWYYAEVAILYNFPDFLKYLQEELKLDFSEEIEKLPFESREELDNAIRLAARSGECKIVEYAMKEFRSPLTFNAAFIGAAQGHQLNLLYALAASKHYKIDQSLLNSALFAACKEGHEDTVEELMRWMENKPSLAADAYGNDAVDHLVDITLHTLSLLLTGSDYESDKWIGTVGKAEEIVRLLKEHHRTDKIGIGKMLFRKAKKFLRDPQMQLPDFIKIEIMKRTCCPWLEQESESQLPSRSRLRSRIKYVRRTMIVEHFRCYMNEVPDKKIRRLVLHALITAYQDAESIAEFHRLAPIYADRILLDSSSGNKAAK